VMSALENGKRPKSVGEKMAKFSDDPVVMAIISGISKRYIDGLNEYGIPFSGAPYDTLACLEEALEEAMDQVFYLQKAVLDERNKRGG
jgi:hypothetical protein